MQRKLEVVLVFASMRSDEDTPSSWVVSSLLFVCSSAMRCTRSSVAAC